MMKKIVILITLLIIAIVIASILLRPQPKLPPSISINTTNQPMLGKKAAKINIVTFEDLKCMACKEFNNTIFQNIKQKYIETGRANLTFINLAFIPNSEPAANAAHCVYLQNPNLFFPFIEYVYAHQPPETENWATIPKLAEFASHISGINIQKLSECIYKQTGNHFIQKNFNLAQQILGDKIVTPSVFINGIKVDPLTEKQIDLIINQIND